MSNSRSNFGYRRFGDFGNWWWSLCQEVDPKPQKAWAKECGLDPATFNKLLRDEQLQNLHYVLPVVIRKGACNSANEVYDKLKWIDTKLKALKNSEKIMAELIEKIENAFATRPTPQRQASGKTLTQEQMRKMRIIADIFEELLDDGLFDN